MKRDQFILPSDQIYLCGHSLGPCTYTAEQRVSEAMQDWKTQVVKAWNTCDWMDLPRQVAANISSLIGAREHEVNLSDSTSVNLYKVLRAALRLRLDRDVILTSEDNFSADLYIAEGVSVFEGKRLLVVPAEELAAHLDERVAVLLMTHVNFRTAAVHPMDALTKQAQAVGALTVWDLSHSVGIMPLELHETGVDMAVGCTYKYLSGGPGAPAFLYVHEQHHDAVQSPIYGWMGVERKAADSSCGVWRECSVIDCGFFRCCLIARSSSGSPLFGVNAACRSP